jgi:hypothetical protein
MTECSVESAGEGIREPRKETIAAILLRDCLVGGGDGKWYDPDVFRGKTGETLLMVWRCTVKEKREVENASRVLLREPGLTFY